MFMPSARYRRVAWAGAGLILCVALAACNRWHAPIVTVPIEKNAALQYRFALNYQQQANLPLIQDDDRYRMEREAVRQTFGKVPEYFPADREFTPLARIDMILVNLGLDENVKRSPPSEREVKAAIRQLEAVSKDYPEYAFVQAQSKYLEGNYYKYLGDFPKAQACFKEVMDKFQDDKNSKIQNLGKRAALLYKQVYVSEHP